MRFSIVAPNLNEMPYFESFFLNSLSRQTFKDFEVIVVDGGSTDGCLEVIEKYRDKLNLKLIIDKTKNIGYIRNVGCRAAEGDILVNTSSDIHFDRSFFKRLDLFYEERPELCAMGCRTVPHGSSVPPITYLAYCGFDILRFLMTCRFMPFKKLRPAGNFTALPRDMFEEVGGFPEVKINEDGLLGYKLDEYWKRHGHKTCYFSLNFRVIHHVKRFEKKGGLGGILFYIYVIGHVFPFLKPLLDPIERIRAQTFSTRSDL